MSAELSQLGHALRNVRWPKGKREQALHDYWNLLHAAGHLALLGTMGGDSGHFQELAFFGWLDTVFALVPSGGAPRD